MQKRARFFDDKDCIIVFVVIAVHIGLGFTLGHHSIRSYEKSSSQHLAIQFLGDGGGALSKPTQPSITLTSPGDTQAPSSLQINLGDHEVLDSAAVISSNYRLQSRNVFSNPRPLYPLASRRMGQQGDVHLKLCVNPDGIVHDIWVAKTSGYALLDKSALDAVKVWRFLALNSANSSVECYHLPIHFSLEA